MSPFAPGSVPAQPAGPTDSSASNFPLLSAAAVYLYQSVNLDKIYQRLFFNADQFEADISKSQPAQSKPNPGILAQADRDLLNSEEVRTFFTAFTGDAAQREASGEKPVPKGILALLTRLRYTWPPSLLLPVLDLMRIIALHPKGSEPLCKEPSTLPSGQVIHAPLSVASLFNKYVLSSAFPPSDASSSSSSPPTGTAHEAPKLPPEVSTRIMCGRIAVNLFANSAGSKYVVSEDHVELYLKGAAVLLSQIESFPQMAQVGACLIQSIALTLGAGRDGCACLNEQAVKALSAAIRSETKHVAEQFAAVTPGTPPVRTDTLEILVKALGVVLMENETGMAIFLTLDSETSAAQALDTIRSNKTWGNVAALAGEVCIITEQ